MRRIPYVLHEKDVRPGLATRYFAAGAAAVCTTLPGTEKRLNHGHVVLTGVPLRDGFVPRTPNVPPRVLLVTGGSQGARHINQSVWSVLDGLCARFEEVIHVAGAQGAEGFAPQYPWQKALELFPANKKVTAGARAKDLPVTFAASAP